MKSMKDRSMKASGGGPDSDGFFPSEPKHMIYKKVGDIKGFHYPDQQEDIYKCQEDMVKKVSGNRPKPEYRH